MKVGTGGGQCTVAMPHFSQLTEIHTEHEKLILALKNWFWCSLST